MQTRESERGKKKEERGEGGEEASGSLGGKRKTGEIV